MNEIDAIIASVNKAMKDEVLVRGSSLVNVTYQRAPSGSLSFDLMLGGGWPLNTLNEVVGNESSGKTSLILKTLAANQAVNPKHHTLWCAAEEFDFAWAKTLGVDVAKMTFVVSNTMEEVYESALQVMTERAADAIVIDSVPALVPSEEEAKTMMEMSIGRGALLTNKFMRKSYRAAGRSLTEPDRSCLCLIVNQWRDRVGTIYGDPRTTPGGRGKNYRFVTRVEVSRGDWLTDGERHVGQQIKCHTLKNKTAPPRRTGQVDFYVEGIEGHPAGSYDTIREEFDLALVHDLLERHGSWFHFGLRKWQGKEAVWEAMKQDQSLVDAIDTAVRNFCGLDDSPGGITEIDKRRKRRVTPA